MLRSTAGGGGPTLAHGSLWAFPTIVWRSLRPRAQGNGAERSPSIVAWMKPAIDAAGWGEARPGSTGVGVASAGGVDDLLTPQRHHLGFGRIVASEMEAPNILVHLV